MTAVALAACGGDDDRGERASTATSTTAAPAGIPALSTSTTAAAPSTTVASRTTTTAASPEGHARALFNAWAAGDRTAAAEVARSEAVAALFARQWRASDGWELAECSGAAGSVVCTWRRPTGQQLLVRVQSAAGGGPVTVSEIRFQP